MIGLFERIELDIGSGHGEFTLQVAKEHPTTLFTGIDIRPDAVASAEEKRKKSGLTNIIFQHAEARKYLTLRVGSSSVDGFHIYFPTPYFKTMRRENRLAADISGWLVSPSFLSEISRTAKRGAVLRFASDHERYFEYAARLFEMFGFRFVEWMSPIKGGRHFYPLIGSGCERSHRREGRPIRYLQCMIR